MTLPSTFDPLVTRIKEVADQGLGVGTRKVDAGRFDVSSFYQGKDDANLSRDTLKKPQLAIRIEAIANTFQIHENANFSQYEIQISLDIAYSLPPSSLEAGRTILETAIANDVHTLRRALANPTALRESAAGNETGLASGKLEFLDSGPPEFDYPNGLARNSLRFSGIIFLANAA